MRIRKYLVVCFAALLAGIGLAVPTTASAAIPVTCGTQSGGNANLPPPNFPQVKDVRVGHHSDYDRFVIEFTPGDAPLPGWQAIPKSSATFYKDSSGLRLDLEGMAGIKLVVHPIASGLYNGPPDFDTEFPQLAEAALLGDIESHFTWGLGLTKQSCKRIFSLTNPTRLVLDVPIS